VKALKLQGGHFQDSINFTRIQQKKNTREEVSNSTNTEKLTPKQNRTTSS
jgi:hypothetical protein